MCRRAQELVTTDKPAGLIGCNNSIFPREPKIIGALSAAPVPHLHPSAAASETCFLIEVQHVASHL
jgi:hypothetical protein